MIRRLTPLVLALVIAAGCAGDSEDPSASYFEDAAAISTRYETAAFSHFTEYQAALESATPETGDDVYVAANQDLFSGLADDFGAAVSGLAGLTAPEDAVNQHDAWLAAARTLSGVFTSADDQLSTLTEASAVNTVVSGLPLADLQVAYRSACDAMAVLSGAEQTTIIACEPPGTGA